MKKIAIVFPGQGAQYPMMGKDFYDQYEAAKAVFDYAETKLPFSLSDFVFQDATMENATDKIQPAIVVTSLMIYQVLLEKLNRKPDALLGFSLGEYSALYAAGIFTQNQIIDLIQKRGMWMKMDANKQSGGMIAVVGGNQDLIEEVCYHLSSKEKRIWIANYNSPNQLVLSGHHDLIDQLIQNPQQLQAKRVIKLQVEGAFHTPYMDDASKKMFQYVNQIGWASPNIPIVMNATAKELENHQLPALMQEQMRGPVYFEKSVRHLIREGIDCFIEIGPGKVLSGLIKKINPDIEVYSVQTIDDIKNMEEIIWN